jgi:hypothetical protein
MVISQVQQSVPGFIDSFVAARLFIMIAMGQFILGVVPLTDYDLALSLPPVRRRRCS